MSFTIGGLGGPSPQTPLPDVFVFVPGRSPVVYNTAGQTLAPGDVAVVNPNDPVTANAIASGLLVLTDSLPAEPAQVVASPAPLLAAQPVTVLNNGRIPLTYDVAGHVLTPGGMADADASDPVTSALIADGLLLSVGAEPQVYIPAVPAQGSASIVGPRGPEGPPGPPGPQGPQGPSGSSLPVDIGMFSLAGPLVPTTGAVPYPADGNYQLVSVTISAGTAPTGASIICDVQVGGTSIFEINTANRPTIPAGGTYGQSGTPDITAVAKGSLITVSILQVGSIVAGSNLGLVISALKLS